MTNINFYTLNTEQKKIIFSTAGEKVGLPAFAIEKDWWAVHMLRILYSMDIGNHLLFKGGTSLSKAWGLIDRFSEDIDLSLNREYLGFKSGMISKSQVNKLRKKSYEFITKNLIEDLKKAFLKRGINDLRYEFENLGDNDQDPISILIYYPPVVTYSTYINPRIKIEIGSRSMRDPFTERPVRSIVGNVFSDRSYAEKEISIPCVNPERTYLEKLFLLHEEFQKPKEKIRIERLSRHLYDIYMIAQSDYKGKALNTQLIKEIIMHRERFNNLRGISYSNHYPPHLKSLPPADVIKDWEQDYRRMQESMIHGESPEFDDLISVISEELKIYNQLKITPEGK